MTNIDFLTVIAAYTFVMLALIMVSWYGVQLVLFLNAKRESYIRHQQMTIKRGRYYSPLIRL